MGASRLASSRRLASVSRPATPDSRDRVVVMSVHRARATTPSFPTHSSILRGGRARGVDAKRASPNTRALEHTSTFADAVAGEWIGHCASFDPRTGNASSLPSHLVPDAFREWGMEIKDWQSQCSTTPRADGNALYVKDARFVPVVGCEADASTVESYERDDIVVDEASIEEGGGYSACYEDEKGTETVTHCVVVPNATPAPIRVRMKHRADGFGVVRIWRESFDEPFSDGASLASSCGGNSATAKFAEYPPDAVDVVARVDAAFTLPTDAVALPAGIWFTLTANDTDGSYASTLGYAHEATGTHVVSVRARASASAESTASFERRVSNV